MSTNILSTKVLNGNNITGHHVKSTKTFVKNFTKSNPPKSTKIDQNVKAALLKGAGKVESQVKLENATLAKSTPLAQASQKGGGNDSPIKKALTTIDENQNYEPKSMSAPTMDGNNGPEASVIEYSKTATQTIVSETGSLVSATLNSVSNPQDVYLDEDLTDEQNTLFDKLRNECETLDNDVKKFAQNLTEFQKMDPKTRKDKGIDYKKEMKTFAKQRIELQNKVQATLTKLDKAISPETYNEGVHEFRTQLIGSAVDLAFPDVCVDTFEASLQDQFEHNHTSLADKDSQAGIKHRKELVNELRRMREDLGDADKASVVTGAFLKTLSRSAANGKTFTPAEKVKLLSELTKTMRLGDTSLLSSKIINNTDSDVTAMVNTLRTESYKTDAARQLYTEKFPDSGKFDDGGKWSAHSLGVELKEAGHGAVFKERMVAAEEAATLRADYEAQKETVARAIGVDNAALAESSILMKAVGAKMGDGDSLENVQNEAVQGVLKEFAKKNVKGAFMIGKLAMTMENLAKKEQEALGSNAFNMPFTEDNGTLKSDFDAAALIDVLGLDKKDLEDLQYDAAEPKAFLEHIDNLAENFKGPEQLNTVKKRIGGANKVLQNNAVQSNLQASQETDLVETGRLVAKTIAEDAVQTIDMQDDSILADSETAVDQAMTGICSALDQAVFKTAENKASRLGQAVKGSAATIAKIDADIIETGKELAQAKKTVTDAENAFKTALSKTGIRFGNSLRNFEADQKLKGLESNQLVLKALNAQDVVDSFRRRVSATRDELDYLDAQIEARDAALEELGGYDPKTMNRSGNKKNKPTIEDLKPLREAAQALVDVRLGRKNVENLTAKGLNLQQGRAELVDGRAKDLGDKQKVANRVIHAAVLQHMAGKGAIEDGGKLKQFDLSTIRDAVVDTLTEWGLDQEAFAPEINEIFANGLDLATMKAWKDDAMEGDNFGVLLNTEEVGSRLEASNDTRLNKTMKAVGNYFTARRAINNQMRAEFENIFANLNDKTKYDLKAGTAIQGKMKVPLEPSATATIKLKLKATVFNNLVVERSGDKYKVTVNHGIGAKLSAALEAKLGKATPDIDGGGKAALVAKADIHGALEAERKDGFTLTFKNKDEAMDMLMTIVDGSDLSLELFEHVSNVEEATSHKFKATMGSEMGASAGAYWQPMGDDGTLSKKNDDPNFQSGATNKQGLGVSVGASADIGISGKRDIISNNQTTVKTEVEKSLTMGAKANANATIVSAFGLATSPVLKDAQQAADKNNGKFDAEQNNDNVQGKFNISNVTATNTLAEVNAEVAFKSVTKHKYEFERTGADGTEVLKKAELEERTNVAAGQLDKMMQTVLSDGAIKKIKDQKKGGDLVKMFETGVKFGLNDCLFSVTYGLSKGAISEVNELSSQADKFELDGDKDGARLLRQAANEVMTDRANYVPAKITLISKSADKDDQVKVNAHLIQGSVASEVGQEHVVATIKL